MKILKNIKNTFMDMDKTILFVSLILIVFGTLNIVTAIILVLFILLVIVIGARAFDNNCGR